MPYVTLTENLN